ncbi:MAG TPA: GntG family PLP-dependent aldolase [Cyclobacteriaceae bacterium]|nr:GntG family PLP-dependent aldolase [Cyclobacteriaceae bacterium]
MKIDLRSDTVTLPTPGMRDAMMSAPIGDDVFGEDPTVNQLEKKIAALFGKEAAVYCPSGTMTNQVGIRILTNPFEEMICYSGAHIYRYEGGGLAGNSQLSVRLLDGDRGRFTVKEIEQNINNSADPHQPFTTLIALENTVVRGGGSVWSMAQLRDIRTLAVSKGIKTHLDGARVFNALAETGDNPADLAANFDTVSVCLSKGLGAPVGSVLLCNKDVEYKARRARKAFGGGMRQVGFLAAAGIYALDNHVARLKDDHRRAKAIGNALEDLPWIDNVVPVDTNIIIFSVIDPLTPDQVLAELSNQNIRAVKFRGPKEIRMVTHLDFNDDMLDRTVTALKKLRFN